ncbi:alpha/beta fold hydrolase [Pseudooceanicola sp.]|uniref:alpha/beta fold hydrolase n=1 Tax=Pseudooceanicola sp. TaxID=1914328 RepID=UPI0035C6B0DB
MHMETVDLNGHPFFIRTWGSPDNPPLLMLHGFPEYGGAWAELAPLLADQFYCVAPDQRGYGRSWSPEGVDNYKVGKLVGDMVALIDWLGGEVTLLGHDWGAAVAYPLTIRNPEKVSRLIIANGVHPIPFQRAVAAGGAQTEASQYIGDLRAEGAEHALAQDDCSALRRRLLGKIDHSWLTPDRFADYLDAWTHDGGRIGTMLNWYRASTLRVPAPGETWEMPEITPENFMVHCPHLLIWGDGDTSLLPVSTEGLEEFAPQLTRVTVPGTDHWLCHQKPEEIAAIIRDWMRGQTGRPEARKTV